MPDKVLVTGANGFLGTAIVQQALVDGYHVRAAVRRQDAADAMQDVSMLADAAKSGALTFALVPDYKAKGALNEAAAGCAAIIHTAAPLSLTPGDLVPENLAGVRAATEACELNKSVRRLVHTQSMLAIASFADQLPTSAVNQAALAGQLDKVPLRTAADAVPNDPPSKDSDPPMQRYTAGKIAARNAMLEYAAATAGQRSFSIVSLLPGFVIGPDVRGKAKPDMFKTTNGMLGFLVVNYPPNAFYGVAPDVTLPLPGLAVDLRDCADAHVKALDEARVPAARARDFLLCTNGPRGVRWNDAIDIAKQRLPQIAAHLPFPARQESFPENFDAKDTEEVLLGRPMRSFEDMVRDTLVWWAGLADA